VTKKFINAVTHVIFEGGKQTTLENAALRPSIRVISPAWVAAFVPSLHRAISLDPR
jgi:hypothetical protein